jgi:hypothetical protein
MQCNTKHITTNSIRNSWKLRSNIENKGGNIDGITNDEANDKLIMRKRSRKKERASVCVADISYEHQG